MGIRNMEYEQGAKKRPWTTIIIVVIVLIGITSLLAAILMPIFASARQAAKYAAAGRDVREVGFAVRKYLDAHHDTYPKFSNGQEVATALGSYLHDPRLRSASALYIWNQKLSGLRVSKLSDPYGEWVFYMKMPYGLRRDFVAYADGHFKSFPDSDIATVLANADRGQLDKASPSIR